MTTPSPNAPASTPDVGGVEPLLPCPFCNSAAKLMRCDDEDSANFDGRWIECTYCQCSTNIRFACGDDPIPLAVAAWNRRVVPACDAQGSRTARMTESYFGLDPGTVKSARRVGGTNDHPLIEVTFESTPVQETGAAATAKIIPDLGRGT